MAPIRKLHFRAVCTFLLLMFGISSRLHVLAADEHYPGESHDEHGHSDSIFGDPFEEILDRLNQLASAEERNITLDETAGMIHSLFEERLQCSHNFNATNCQECLDASSLFSILNVNPSYGLDEENFNRACVVLLYYVTGLDSACADAALSARTYDYFAEEVQIMVDGSRNLTEEELEFMLDKVNRSYAPENFAKCFTVETVFDAAVADHEAGADDHELENVAAILISSLVRGFCIGSPTEVDPDAFLDDIFDTYATDDIMSEYQFIEILEKLAIGGELGDHSEDSHGHAAHRRRRHTDPSVLAGILGRRRRRNVDAGAPTEEPGHDHDHEHEHDHDHASEGVADIHSCFSVDELLDIFGVDHSVGLTRQQFKELSPALIQQVIKDACVHTESTNGTRPSAAEVWGYGVLSVFIISLCAVAGVALLPCLNTSLYEKVLQFMIALAVATLVGDAVVHLIPQAVGLHAHEADSHASHDASSEELAFIWKCLVVVMAVYVFFLFESFMHMFGGGHSHSVEPDSHPTGRKRTPSMRAKEALEGSFKKSGSNAQLEMIDYNEPHEYEGVAKKKNKGGCGGIGSLPFMILIGDGLHNLGDGLAIGAAFATSIGAGLSTSIAVFCHELPHEMGDFAVLLNSGLGFRKALGFNFLSAMMAFVGLCIGIPLAANAEARQWIFAAAAGMFLYVALADMLPELINNELKNKGTIFLLHNLGFLVGTAIILIIALYEDSINISVY